MSPAIHDVDERTAVHLSDLLLGESLAVLGVSRHRTDIHEPSLKTLDAIPDGRVAEMQGGVFRRGALAREASGDGVASLMKANVAFEVA